MTGVVFQVSPEALRIGIEQGTLSSVLVQPRKTRANMTGT